MPGNATTLRPSEVRALLRLCNALHESPPDPAARKRRLLEGLGTLLRADAGVCVVSHFAGNQDGGGDGAASVVVSTARWGVSAEDAGALTALYRPRGDPDGNPHGRDPRARARPRARAPAPAPRAAGPYHAADHCLESIVSVPGMRMRACVILLRRPTGRRRFTPREQALLDVFHGEMLWLYRPDMPMVRRDAQDLTARQRDTLQLLLAGNGEKQIATQLGIRPNTVHHYVKALYRHFAVSSRSELLARWVMK